MKRLRAVIRKWVVPPSRFNLFFRTVIAANMLLIALSWLPWFEGTATKLGVVDHLLGGLRLGGFRADFVWLLLSTIAACFALILFLMQASTNRATRINAYLCGLEILAFCSYMNHVVATGVLNFG
jgi:hypothetical protein